MIKTLRGKIRGRTIELNEDLGLDDGQDVRVQVTTLPAASRKGDGVLQSEGTLADNWTDEDDRILNEIYQDRKRDSRRDIPE